MLIMSDLFDTAGFSVTKEPKLLAFAKVMFASILQYLGNMISALGMKNILIKRIVDCSDKFGVKSQMLLNWGAIVRADFQTRNSTRVAHTDNAYVAHVVSSLQMEVIAMREEQRKMLNCMQTQSNLIADLAQQLRDHNNPGVQLTPQSSRKKDSPRTQVRFILASPHSYIDS